MNRPQPHSFSSRRDILVAFLCGGCVAAMIGLSFAAVPFYSWFCRATGYGGTTQTAKAAGLPDRAAVSISMSTGKSGI